MKNRVVVSQLSIFNRTSGRQSQGWDEQFFIVFFRIFHLVNVNPECMGSVHTKGTMNPEPTHVMTSGRVKGAWLAQLYRIELTIGDALLIITSTSAIHYSIVYTVLFFQLCIVIYFNYL